MRTLPGTVAGALGKGSLSMEAAKSTDKERTSGAAGDRFAPNSEEPS